MVLLPACRRRNLHDHHHHLLFILLICILLQFPSKTDAASRILKHQYHNNPTTTTLKAFREAPAFRNGDNCSNNVVQIVMTLDVNYLRGSVAAVFSILRHATCPENVAFHFLHSSSSNGKDLEHCIRSTFPYLSFRLYRFNSALVRGKISTSVRQALDQPLNYARIYLAEILPKYVTRVIYLDSDLIVFDDIAKLWNVDLNGKVIAAPEYCHANFTSYFTDGFWSDAQLSGFFKGRTSKPCYFNTGVMVLDMEKWRGGGYLSEIEWWMKVQKQRRIYRLGSLPPFLLVFGGEVMGVDHQWNQHGLGGDNLNGDCRDLHPGPVSLLHWSGKGKPWLRLDSRKPCPIDSLWAPYDLYRSSLLLFDE